jgi:hypothetical protein
VSQTCVGWGVQGWGTQWGGYCYDDGPTGGFIPGGGTGSRYERIRREQEWREEREQQNVLFRVSGLRATARIGTAFGGGGRGLTAYAHGLRMRVLSHPATIAATTETRLSMQQMQALLGRVSVESSVGVDGVRAQSSVGSTKVRAVRNLSDEELINFLDDLL